MADKLKKSETAESGATAAPENAAPKAAEAEYTAEEFAGNAAHLFGRKATADIVTAAFMLAGKATATPSEARVIVEKFMNREVG